MKSVMADKDIVENEKRYLEEKLKKSDERLLDLEFQLKQPSHK